MLGLYGKALLRERLGSDDGGDIAQYLKWEYGGGTGIGVLNVRASPRRRVGQRWGSRILDRMAARSGGIRGGSRNAWPRRVERRLMTLLAQWKQGRIRTVELVSLLEDLRRTETVLETS